MTFPNLWVAVQSTSAVSLYFILGRVLISSWYFIHSFVCWPANSTGMEAQVGQAFVCLAYLLSLPWLKYFLAHRRTPNIFAEWMNDPSQFSPNTMVGTFVYFTNKKTRHGEVEWFAHSRKARKQQSKPSCGSKGLRLHLFIIMPVKISFLTHRSCFIYYTFSLRNGSKSAFALDLL